MSKGYAILGTEYRVMLKRKHTDVGGKWELDDEPTTFYQDAVVVRVQDEGAGPYLLVRGETDADGVDGVRETDIVICDERDVDNLAHALKRILREHATAKFDQGDSV